MFLESRSSRKMASSIEASHHSKLSKKRNIIFIHPDLGIGGAERLIIDAAVGLQKLGNTVTIFTSHCDPKHCFEEARDGKDKTASYQQCMQQEARPTG